MGKTGGPQVCSIHGRGPQNALIHVRSIKARHLTVVQEWLEDVLSKFNGYRAWVLKECWALQLDVPRSSPSKRSKMRLSEKQTVVALRVVRSSGQRS